MIDRRLFAGALAGTVLAVPFSTDAQPTGKVWRIGYIGYLPAGASPCVDRIWDAFLQALARHEFVEGKNIVFERRAMEGRLDRAPALVTELLGLRADVLVVASTAAARAAKEATMTIPIVMIGVADSIATGLVASLARPGGNITGVTDFGDDLYLKQLELLKSAVPKAVRFVLLGDDDSRRYGTARADALRSEQDAAARALGIRLLRVAMNGPQDFQSATATVVRERADALVVGGIAATALRAEIAEFAIRQRLPVVTASGINVTAGAMLSYGLDNSDIWRKAATYVAKILNGAKPANLPVERPTKFELVVNLNTAKAIGVTIPQSLLLRADEVIQ